MSQYLGYNKCSKISNTEVSEKIPYANSADSDQTASGAVLSGSILFVIPLSILRNNCIKSKPMGKLVLNKVFEILGHLP